MNSSVRLFCFCFILSSLCACVDKIELSAPDQPESGILVQGRFLFGNPSVVMASVFELYTLSNNLPRPIGGADVLLRDDQGHEIELLSNFDGNYYLELDPSDPDFPIQTGRQYQLSALLPNGQIYQSDWETLLAVPPIDSIHTEWLERDAIDNLGQLVTEPYIRFGVSTDLTTAGNIEPLCMRWEFDAAYRITDDLSKTCYTIRNLLNDNVFVFDGASLAQTNLVGYPLAETLVDYRFAEGFYIVVYQQSISKNAYGYFEELNQLLARRGTLFDPPAGAIRTNISNISDPAALVYGFFYVAAQDTARLYISPDMASNPTKRCPIPPSLSGEPGPPNSCDDCLLEAGEATLQKPTWWFF